MANFASRERGLFGNVLPFDAQPQRANLGQLSLNLMGGSGTKSQVPALSGNDSRDTISESRDAISSITNPNVMWNGTGIGFDS